MMTGLWERAGRVQPRQVARALCGFAAIWIVIGLGGCRPVEAISASQVWAFPGAEGFGRFAVGGRSGVVCEVTRLDDYDPSTEAPIPATFRWCAQRNSGPRTVVFRTGGTVSLKTRVNITNPFLTIAGQTAPGGGIAIAGGAINVVTQDVIIRHIRVRPGPRVRSPGSGDGIAVKDGAANVILDQVSVSWATDENLDSLLAQNVTVQWSILAEGLDCSTHPDGCHSKGVFIAYGNENSTVTFHHNLIAFNVDRTPLIEHGQVDYVNNVAYLENRTALTPERFGPIKVNLVKNYYKQTSTPLRNYEIQLKDGTYRTASSVYLSSNRVETSSGSIKSARVLCPSTCIPKRSSRHPFPKVTTVDAKKAFKQVLARAGATLPARDAVDQRITNNVLNRTGQVINDPADVGGYPELAPGTPPTDTDHDGMPDSWEGRHGLNPNNAADRNGDPDGDGYTNLEEYLNGTDPRSAT